MVQLSHEQEKAVDAVGDWLKRRDKPYFVLHGLAGTGKSTIASHLAAQHNGPSYFTTYTACAAKVLRDKGAPNCKNLHRYIYLPIEEAQEEAQELEDKLQDPKLKETEERRIRRRLTELYSPDFVKRPKSPFESHGLVVLDECSMISGREANDLLSFGIPVLVLGDPGQLPPIEGRGYFNDNPDYLLTEIHRQAKESPIIQLAMAAREGRPLKRGVYGQSSVISKQSITQSTVANIDQIATGRNTSRISFNEDVRAMRGYEGPFPRKGERVMCLRNNHKIGIANGDIFTVSEDADLDGDSMHLCLVDSDGGVEFLEVHTECFTDPEIIKSWSSKRRGKKEEFTYCYAATIHKLQGQQFGRVLVYPDMFTWPGVEDKYRSLLYTAITRAVEEVTIAL